jgi:hypothetical protein
VFEIFALVVLVGFYVCVVSVAESLPLYRLGERVG